MERANERDNANVIVINKFAKESKILFIALPKF